MRESGRKFLGTVFSVLLLVSGGVLVFIFGFFMPLVRHARPEALPGWHPPLFEIVAVAGGSFLIWLGGRDMIESLQSSIRFLKKGATPWIRCGWVLVVLVIFLAASLFNRSPLPEPPHGLQTRLLFRKLLIACQMYENEFKSPPGDSNAKIVKALTGDNSGKIVFVELKPEDLNSKGEVVDAWGNPLRFSFDKKTGIRIQSAGMDGVWGTFDDLDSTR